MTNLLALLLAASALSTGLGVLAYLSDRGES